MLPVMAATVLDGEAVPSVRRGIAGRVFLALWNCWPRGLGTERLFGCETRWSSGSTCRGGPRAGRAKQRQAGRAHRLSLTAPDTTMLVEPMREAPLRAPVRTLA